LDLSMFELLQILSAQEHQTMQMKRKTFKIYCGIWYSINRR
jgi:hypothetical protein